MSIAKTGESSDKNAGKIGENACLIIKNVSVGLGDSEMSEASINKPMNTSLPASRAEPNSLASWLASRFAGQPKAKHEMIRRLRAVRSRIETCSSSEMCGLCQDQCDSQVDDSLNASDGDT